MSKSGKIVQVIGAVVDVVFQLDSVPDILDAITINYKVDDDEKKLTLEVQQHLYLLVIADTTCNLHSIQTADVRVTSSVL